MNYRRILCLIVIFILFSPPGAMAFGVGLRWTTEGILLGFGETKCIPYGVYNPFGVDEFIRLEATGSLSDIVSSINPPEALVPGGTGPSNATRFDLCLYGKRGEFPYKPANYHGDVLAIITGTSSAGGTGSVLGASIAAPLDVRVGDLSLYNKIRKIAIILGVLIIVGSSYIVLRRYRRKKWESTIRNECPKCKKTFSYETKFCPDDGTELVKYKGDERLE